MLNRVHRKILRTIQALPVRCPSVALTSLIGSNDIQRLVVARQLSFVNSFAWMDDSDLPKQVLLAKVNAAASSGITQVWESSLADFSLPDIKSLISTGGKNQPSWKRHIRKQISITQHLHLVNICDTYPVSDLSLKLCKPCQIWSSTRKCRSHTPAANFRIRLLTGCDGLEKDATRFRYRKDNAPPGNPLRKILGIEPEDARHFLVTFPVSQHSGGNFSPRPLFLSPPPSPMSLQIPVDFLISSWV